MCVSPVVVSWGGGVNSTALMVGLAERGELPDLILFADTGGEWPETYEYRDGFDQWLRSRGLPGIETVRYHGGKYGTLENQCNVTGMLPAPAYGGRSCSIRWKQEPMDARVASWKPAVDCWAAGGKVVRLIGYDAGESRAGESITEDDRYVYRFPLKAWGWDRKACVAAIERAGLCVPRKSSCFFCPAMKKHEVIELATRRPELFGRALEIEENAAARHDLEGRTDGAKGLGRRWSWRALSKADREQQKLFDNPPPFPCMCWDGSPGDEPREGGS
jgi:hypothetical protein